MTNKERKHRRWLHSCGPDKVLKIVKNKVRHHAIFFIPPMNYFSFWERLKSLFIPGRYTISPFCEHNGRNMNISVGNLK